jgi:hypothetical protein
MATYWQWKRLFIDNYKDNNAKETSAVSKKSMQFLNLHIGEHWPLMIRTYGSPSEYSTQHWESLHQIVKAKEKTTNHTQPSHDIARGINEKHCLQLQYGDLEVSFASTLTLIVFLQRFISNSVPVNRFICGNVTLKHKVSSKAFPQVKDNINEYCINNGKKLKEGY